VAISGSSPRVHPFATVRLQRLLCGRAPDGKGSQPNPEGLIGTYPNLRGSCAPVQSTVHALSTKTLHFGELASITNFRGVVSGAIFAINLQELVRRLR